MTQREIIFVALKMHYANDIILTEVKEEESEREKKKDVMDPAIGFTFGSSMNKILRQRETNEYGSVRAGGDKEEVDA